MEKIKLFAPTEDYLREIEQYRNEFSIRQMQARPDPDRIPGLDHLEEFGDVPSWLRFCETQKDRVRWYMSVRSRDGCVVGFCCLRLSLEYDDDDPEFASHIGYSVRPSEQGRGYGKEQLRLMLEEARVFGMDRVRLICRDVNIASSRVILANGGTFVDSIRGEESGMTVDRYDIQLR